MSVMIRTVLASLASAMVLGAGLTTASADTFVERVTVSRFIACYDRVYVPARVLVNTRGRLVRAASTGWEVSPTRWNRVRSPATYIQTRRVISPDHFTLVQRGC